MNRFVRRVMTLGVGVWLLATSQAMQAKPPEEQALRQYGLALQELGNILHRVSDVASARAAVPAIDKQIAAIQALQAQLATQAEGDPAQKPKKGEEKTSADVKALTDQIRQFSTRLSQELQRVLADPAVAKVLQPSLSKLANG